MILIFSIGAGTVLADGVNGSIKPYTQCRIISITDGDTVKMYCDRRGFETARLVGFDTPEFNARCLRELGLALGASYVLRWLLWSHWEIGVQTFGRDRYGRRLAAVTIDGRNLSDEIIATGFARPYSGGRRQGWCP